MGDECTPPTPSKFTPPSVYHVREYCAERGNSIDPQEFVDFYSSKNWMVGKTKMTDWKACVRTWERRRSEEQKGNGKPVPINPFMREDVHL